VEGSTEKKKDTLMKGRKKDMKRMERRKEERKESL
jgi:hypothetical protein